MNEKNPEERLPLLVRELEKQNSIARNFLIGIVRGFGTAIGATVVFGLVLAGFFQAIKSIDYVPILNTILSSQAVEELIHRFTQPPL